MVSAKLESGETRTVSGSFEDGELTKVDNRFLSWFDA
jgi:hypothetical protein